MHIDGTIAMLYAQTGFTARTAHDSSTGPHTMLAMSRALAEEMAALERKQVQAPDPSVESRVADNNDQRSKQDAYGSRRRNRAKHEKNNSEQDTATDPLVGNFLNIKV